MFDWSCLKIKIDDPLILKWALYNLEGLQKTNPSEGESFEKEVFNELALCRLLDQGEAEDLVFLFRLLKAQRFSPFIDKLADAWPSAQGPLAGWSARVIAQLEPEAAVGLFDDFVGSQNCFRDDNKTFGVFQSLMMLAPRRGSLTSQQLLLGYDQLYDSYSVEIYFSEAFGLAYRHGFVDSLKLLEKLPLVYKNENDLESGLERIYRKITGDLPYFSLAREIISKRTRLSFSQIPRLFAENAPLADLDKLCRTRNQAAIRRALELFPPRAKQDGIGSAELSRKLLELEAKFSGKKQKDSLASLIIGLLASEFAATNVNWSECGLAELIDYAASDLRFLPGCESMVERIRAMNREEVSKALGDRFPKEWETFGGVSIARMMGDLAYLEFAPILLASLDQDGDYLCEAAMIALGKLGEAGEKEICETWNSLSESQQIFSFGALEHCGGERTIKLLADIFPEQKGSDIEQWCITAQSVPDPRLIEALEPELKRKQDIIDETFVTLCALLDYDHPGLKEARARWMRQEEEQRAKKDAFYQGELEGLMAHKMHLELSCPLCGESNTYEVAAVFVGLKSKDSRPFVGEELYCLSCGELAELKLTDKGYLAVTAELLKAVAVKKTGKVYKGPIKFLDARLADGRTVSLEEGISYYQKRLQEAPASVVDRLSLGNCYRNANHPTRAMAQYEKAIQTDPAYVEASLELAYLLKESGRRKEAWETLDRALAHLKQWKFCRLLEITEQEFYRAFAELYNELSSLLKIKDKPALHYSFAEKPGKISEKIGRNDHCPCGSGKKYKKCCLGKKD